MGRPKETPAAPNLWESSIQILHGRAMEGLTVHQIRSHADQALESASELTAPSPVLLFWVT